MNFQQKMYLVFCAAIAMLLTASIIALLNGRKVEGLSYWLILAAIIPFTAGLPAFINQHLNLWPSPTNHDDDKEQS